MIGSVGSVAVAMRVLGARLFFEALPTTYLTPRFRPDAPDTLLSVTEKRKVAGRMLRDSGYDIDDSDLGRLFWFQRVWDGNAETWFTPWPTSEERDFRPIVDAARTVEHSLGFVPMAWIKNLPGGDAIDGDCTFRAAIETTIEIDYQLSQAGRGLKYSSDPLLMIREPAASEGEMIRSAGNALIVSQDGDAKLLEIGGTAAAAVVDYVKHLREMALEATHGMRASPDKMAGIQSGRALEVLHQPLIWLADRLRSSYGEGGLLALLDMVRAATRKFPLTLKDGTKIAPIPAGPVSLVWPAWFTKAPEDLQADAVTVTTLTAGGLMSRPTAIKALAADYDIEDVEA
jgi:hypothetical protein